ncbi:hypothetical protein MTO96_038776 [Rhipicephalus appendiculatus]
METAKVIGDLQGAMFVWEEVRRAGIGVLQLGVVLHADIVLMQVISCRQGFKKLLRNATVSSHRTCSTYMSSIHGPIPS